MEEERNDERGLHQLGWLYGYASIALTGENPWKHENLHEARAPSCS